jgi:hypothetical protein
MRIAHMWRVIEGFTSADLVGVGPPQDNLGVRAVGKLPNRIAF